jgi:hypothetical protein
MRTTLLRIIYLAVLVIWVGGVTCFSLLVAPALFSALPTTAAGDAAGAIFPGYYAAGAACGLILLAVSVLLYAETGRQLWWRINTALIAVMLLSTAYAGLVVYPRTVELRPQIRVEEPPPQLRAEFGRLHGIAVGLNMVVLLCGLGAVGVTAGRLRW